MNKFIHRMLCLLCLAATASIGAEELEIVISKGVNEAIPIAVVPFAWNGSGPVAEDVGQIVADDLQRSGEFNPLARANMLSVPTRREDVFFRDWRLLGQDYLLIGRLSFSASDFRYRAEYELYDVPRGQRIIGGSIAGERENLRDIGHYIADEVYQQLTGVKGIFSTKIAYVTAEDLGTPSQRYRLQVADADGRRSQVIYSTSEPILSPAWSPDGRRIAYVLFKNGRAGVYIQTIGVRRDPLQVSSFKGLSSAPAWSPDGNQLALTLTKDGNAEIYIANLADLVLTRFTRHSAIDTEAHWDPSGTSLVFTSDRGGRPQVYRQSLAGGGAERLTFSGRLNARPRLSADGKVLFMVHQRDGSFHIARQELATGEVSILSQTDLDESPSVAPNGSMLIYATRNGGKDVLTVVSTQGGERYVLPSKFGDVREPAWSPFLN